MFQVRFHGRGGQIRHRVPVTDYLRVQARYAHLFRPPERTDVIARLQAAADRNIARFGLLQGQSQDHDQNERPVVSPIPQQPALREG